MSPNRPLPQWPGSRFELLGRLGAGGMASVYRARDRRGEIPGEFALKVASQSRQDMRRAMAEELLLRQLRGHPNMVELIYADWEVGPGYWLAMELLTGRLEDVLQAGKLPPRRALSGIRGVAVALRDAYATKKIVHRDLKPANVFLHCNGAGVETSKVIDFGIAAVAGGSAPPVLHGVGTPGYMCHDQFAAYVNGSAPDPRDDIFAAGAILYEMLTGQKAFTSDLDRAARVYQIQPTGGGPLPPPVLVDPPTAQPTIHHIIERCVASRRVDRYSSWGELIAAIDQALRLLPPDPAPSTAGNGPVGPDDPTADDPDRTPTAPRQVRDGDE